MVEVNIVVATGDDEMSRLKQPFSEGLREIVSPEWMAVWERYKELETQLDNHRKQTDHWLTLLDKAEAQLTAAKQVISDWQNDYAPDPLPDGVLQFVEDLNDAITI